MKLKTRRKLRKSKVNNKFQKGGLKLSVSDKNKTYWIKRDGMKIARQGVWTHTLTLLEHLNVRIDDLCGKKYRRKKWFTNKIFKSDLPFEEKFKMMQGINGKVV